MMGLGLIWMFLFWGGLVALAIWLVGLLFPTGPKASDPAPLSAQEILKARYSRGELSREQYLEMLHTIQNQ